MDTADRYREYRTVDQALMVRVGETVTRSVMNRAAQMLQIGQSNVMRNEPETALSILIDFALHDIRSNGESAVQRYRVSPGPDNAMEDELLTAHALATTSLYKVIETGLPDDTILLQDLLRTADDIRLVDVNLSKSAKPGLLIFARCLFLEGLSMNTGMALGFPPQVESTLLADYRQRLSQVDLAYDERRRFVHFFKEFEARGMPTRYLPPLQ